MTQHLRTTCNRDCPDSCGVIATVEDGRIVAHTGDPEHGVTRGFLCFRGNHYLERQYSPDRILYPRRQTKAGWQDISWDDALDLAAEKLDRCRRKSGPLSVLAVTYSGIRGHVAKVIGRLFWAHFGGVTTIKGGLSIEAAEAAQRLDFGRLGTHAPEDLANSRGFAIWGKNIVVTRPHAWAFVAAARKQGAPLHVIDPVRSATAARADRHYQIRPGSDAMLALGVGRLLLERDAPACELVDRHCQDFDAYRQLALSYSLDEIAQATDLSRAMIEELASLYSDVRPLATLIGLGPAYWRQGGLGVRLIDALAALTGNLGVSGGGVSTDTDGSAGLNLSALAAAPSVPMRRILLPRMGKEILETTGPRLELGWIAGANPAATAPDAGRVSQGLASLDFLVVVDQFLTASSNHADLFLPCTTYLEMDDLVTAYGHHWIGLTRRVVWPEGEARSDVEIYQELARRLGFGAHLEGEPLDWIRHLLGPLATHGVTLEALLERPLRNPLVPQVPFAERVFDTPSGRIELAAERPAARAPLADDELHLIATKTLKMVNAQVNASDMPAEPVVRVHPATAKRQGLEAGTMVTVAGKVATLPARLQVDERVRRDVALFNPARWQGDLAGVNQLREAILADLDDAAAMHETRVRLQK